MCSEIKMCRQDVCNLEEILKDTTLALLYFLATEWLWDEAEHVGSRGLEFYFQTKTARRLALFSCKTILGIISKDFQCVCNYVKNLCAANAFDGTEVSILWKNMNIFDSR